jgi:hypothetical protein
MHVWRNRMVRALDSSRAPRFRVRQRGFMRLGAETQLRGMNESDVCDAYETEQLSQIWFLEIECGRGALHCRSRRGFR